MNTGEHKFSRREVLKGGANELGFNLLVITAIFLTHNS